MTPTLYLYEQVTGSTATAFQKQLTAITEKEINLRINSPGGSVFDGLTIYQLLKSHPAKVIVHVDGIAASIASIIALAGDQINISQGAMVMIHDASISTRGNSRQLVKDAATVAKVSESLTDIYVTGTKQTRAKIRQLMEAETWLNASEAVALGFAHKIVASQKIAASASWTASEFPLPLAAKIAAGLMPTRRDFSAEIDRLRSQLATAKAQPNEHSPRKGEQPIPPVKKSATPLADTLDTLTGAERTKFFRSNSRNLKIEDLKAKYPNVLIPNK